MAICTAVWGLGPKGTGAGLLARLLKNQGNEKAEQEGCLKSESWK